VRTDSPSDGECVIPGGAAEGTCVCRGCGPDACPLGCRRSLVLSGCICRTEPDCPDADDVCFHGLCS
jgi:hypothetical protein